MKKTISMPDAFVILLGLALLTTIASYFVIPGSFSSPNAEGSLIQLSDFVRAENPSPVGLFVTESGRGLFNILFEGLVSGDRYGAAIGVVAFILITGGAFGVVMKTNAIENGMMALIDKTKTLDWVFLPALFLVFSLGGAIFGMGEEAIAFCIVLFPILRQLGYDAAVTVLVTYVATQVGFATSPINPFSIAIAQGIADLPLFSGAWLRVVSFVVLNTIALWFTLRYAKRIRQVHRDISTTASTAQMQRLDTVILSVFALCLAWVVYGVTVKGYYIPEIATQFFVLGLMVAFVAKLGGRLTVQHSVDAFKQGSAELLPAALLVGLAKGLVILLGGTDLHSPSMLNTFLYDCASLITLVPDYVAAVAMYVFQSAFNFFVSSGSGQAAITMPLMSPLSDLIGVSRQTAVLAFQLGDGLTNIIIPTSASLIGCLGVTNLAWGDWFKVIWRLMLMLFIASIAFMVFAQFIQYQ
ncbi:putative basic amino acid antiporter YfcC (plasmid) [Pseudoalteromonas xiamenensis]|uniref:putative basic amino acid antiporter YfcC n=1 Tax=Pseudoalteromonas xiamenensis TaxID=882626 RepID=UPI0027E59735|nr:putative basic amino acid antiporter YfcC [Pseudoalteromonas xiamenensis]WMN61625.1 putative basic amino acid antiporter YfcC [Pseudoalteromonas xiamenensis]